ncbi:MAG: metal ABC transporter permease [Rhizobiales bacterium]|nr:metal ABC transporter permease [Hyphomicrobiales bacterium]
MDDFLIRAALGGIGMALIAAPLGCIVVWQRMAYFGETIAHSGLLGVSLGLLVSINPTLAVFLSAVMVTFGLRAVERKTNLAKDTALGLLAHIVLATGLIVTSQFESLQVDLMGVLFGDILAISNLDLYMVGIGLLVIWGVIAWVWQDLLALSIDRELAIAEGVHVSRIEFLFSLAIAATIALSMKLVGLLLVTAMLIIPAAAAMGISRTPEQMVVFTALISCFSVISGLVASLYIDIPTGPAIVVSMAFFFLLTSLVKR